MVDVEAGPHHNLHACSDRYLSKRGAASTQTYGSRIEKAITSGRFEVFQLLDRNIDTHRFERFSIEHPVAGHVGVVVEPDGLVPTIEKALALVWAELSNDPICFQELEYLLTSSVTAQVDQEMFVG